jgi:hypothetical protein
LTILPNNLMLDSCSSTNLISALLWWDMRAALANCCSMLRMIESYRLARS